MLSLIIIVSYFKLKWNWRLLQVCHHCPKNTQETVLNGKALFVGYKILFKVHINIFFSINIFSMQSGIKLPVLHWDSVAINAVSYAHCALNLNFRALFTSNERCSVTKMSSSTLAFFGSDCYLPFEMFFMFFFCFQSRNFIEKRKFNDKEPCPGCSSSILEKCIFSNREASPLHCGYHSRYLKSHLCSFLLAS